VNSRRLRSAAAAFALMAALPAAALEVTLSKRVCDCDSNEGPRTRTEYEKADYRWLDDGRLELQVWASETADSQIDERTPMADWRDGVLLLTHWNRSMPANAEATISCLFTARLTYVVSGLARGTYRVHASPASTITVEGD
jgi:hypothetical protein